MSRRKKPYMTTVLDHLAKAELKPGSIHVIKVRHDSWCKLMKGTGLCNCNPEVGKPERVPKPEDN